MVKADMGLVAGEINDGVRADLDRRTVGFDQVESNARGALRGHQETVGFHGVLHEPGGT